MDNNEEKLPRFENKGSIKYYKDFNDRFNKSKKIFIILFCFTASVIISSSIFGNISIITTIVRLLTISLVAVTYDQLLKISWLNNTYTVAKIGALEDDIKNK